MLGTPDITQQNEVNTSFSSRVLAKAQPIVENTRATAKKLQRVGLLSLALMQAACTGPLVVPSVSNANEGIEPVGKNGCTVTIDSESGGNVRLEPDHLSGRVIGAGYEGDQLPSAGEPVEGTTVDPNNQSSDVWYPVTFGDDTGYVSTYVADRDCDTGVAINGQ